MNRKTNIFYSTGNDSKFLTFDNYAEALTGDVIATDQKLWPSRFICMYVKALDGETNIEREDNKKDFINHYLVPYYENKLAFLRDNIENTEELSNILSLKYLLSLIYYFAADKSNTKNYHYISDAEKDLYNGTYYGSEFTKEDIDINYISDIVEQDYNGTYADIICTISTSVKYKPVLTFNQLEGNNVFDTYYEYKEYNNSEQKLYGWDKDHSEAIQEYINVPILFDNNVETTNVYYTNSLIDTINVERFESEKLKFNVIIPVFDSQYINRIQEHDELVLDNNTNVPLGIYFTGKPVELENDNGIFNTNWSLLISMQFKSFPYSFGITHNFDDSDSIKEAYITFAEILANQNISADLILKYNNQIAELKNKISSLESIIRSLSSVQTLDLMGMELESTSTQLEQKINSIEQKLNILENTIEANKLRWQIKTTEQ